MIVSAIAILLDERQSGPYEVVSSFGNSHCVCRSADRGPRPYFVIAGIFIPVTQWRAIAEELEKLKKHSQFRVRGELKWPYFGSHNDDPRNTVAHLDQQNRDELRKQIFAILKRRNNVNAVACVCSVVHAYKQIYVNDKDDIYSYTYKPITDKPITERFQYHLQDITRTTGVEQYGLIVSDHRGRDDDERVRRYHQKLMHSQSPYISAYDRMIESVFLTPSHTSVGIQLADLFAGAISRAFNFNDKIWFDEIRPIFRSKRNGDIDGYGLVKFPTGW